LANFVVSHESSHRKIKELIRTTFSNHALHEDSSRQWIIKFVGLILSSCQEKEFRSTVVFEISEYLYELPQNIQLDVLQNVPASIIRVQLLHAILEFSTPKRKKSHFQFEPHQDITTVKQAIDNFISYYLVLRPKSSQNSLFFLSLVDQISKSINQALRVPGTWGSSPNRALLNEEKTQLFANWQGFSADVSTLLDKEDDQMKAKGNNIVQAIGKNIKLMVTLTDAMLVRGEKL